MEPHGLARVGRNLAEAYKYAFIPPWRDGPLRRRTKLSILTVVLFCSGCVVTSFNPFYTAGAVISAPELVGIWDLVKNGSDEHQPGEIKPWEIDQEQILTFDEKGRGGPFSYKVFKVGNDTLVDVLATADSALDASDFWVTGVWPVHSLLKLSVEGDQITLTPLNYEWFEQKKESGELTLPMIIPTDEEWGVFNATPEEWMAFLLKYKSEKDFFRDESKIVLKRKKAL